MIFNLDDTQEAYFPDPLELDTLLSVPMKWEPSGLYAIGGKIDSQWLIQAYDMGIFPWFAFKNNKRPHWYCPQERFVIFPDEIHVSHSMRNMINRGIYSVTFNKAFDAVIENCSRLRIDETGAWLGETMVAAYKELHAMGCAASVEVWEGETLVGGLYGVAAGNVFCGESMFSLRPSASKMALIALARRLDSGKKGRFIIDCQFETPHLKSMGGRMIPYAEYRRIMYPE